MTDKEFEFILQDRIMKIQAINEQYNLIDNAYLSFSGGKDSTVLHYLLDLALPENQIPRLFLNTGIEYIDMIKFVRSMAEKDNRIIIYNSGVNIPQMLEKYGYPFKSKDHAMRVCQFNKGLNSNYIKKYINGWEHNGSKSRFSCNKNLLYQFEEKGKYNYSDQCCHKLKKDIAKKWQKTNKKTIYMTGMQKQEGGERTTLQCVVANKNNDGIKAFHPLSVITNEWEDKFIEKYNIKLCKLYYPPYNFQRTGCRGCPFNLNLQHDLDIMEELLPLDFKVANKIWKPVYDEYRRIGYRLRKENKNQMTIWNLLEVEGERR